MNGKLKVNVFAFMFFIVVNNFYYYFNLSNLILRQLNLSL